MASAAPLMTWESAFVSHAGSVRKVNEDAFLEAPDIGLWAIADGMGGHEEGSLASRMVIDALDAVPQPADLASFIDGVRATLSDVNQRLREIAGSYGRGTVIGTTVAVLLACERSAVSLWAGDSRIYLRRQGRLAMLTRDHSRLEEAGAGTLPAAGQAAPRPLRQYLTRAVGAQDELLLDANRISLLDGDEFLLCSDGVNKTVSDEELAALPLDGSCEATVSGLLDLCLARKATDNVTAGLVRVSALTRS